MHHMNCDNIIITMHYLVIKLKTIIKKRKCIIAIIITIIIKMLNNKRKKHRNKNRKKWHNSTDHNVQTAGCTLYY